MCGFSTTKPPRRNSMEKSERPSYTATPPTMRLFVLVVVVVFVCVDATRVAFGWFHLKKALAASFNSVFLLLLLLLFVAQIVHLPLCTCSRQRFSKHSRATNIDSSMCLCEHKEEKRTLRPYVRWRAGGALRCSHRRPAFTTTPWC